VLHSPNDIEGEGVSAEPWNLKSELDHRGRRIRENTSTHGGSYMIGKEENGERAEEFTKVRATNDDL
jgi:hypothetical protein